ncbi:MAG: DASH family cryptochrome [Pedobacter sp.]|nr:MAG: DASH family cryptochrome [Pedobacter sp.]
MSKSILVWFRNDLRLHDNEMLVDAIAKSDTILPVFIFDPRNFEETNLHALKTGWNRTQILLENVDSLRNSFKAKGGNILIHLGYPEQILPELVEKYQISEVYHHREVASEETKVSSAVEDQLWKLKVNLKHFIGHTLYNKEDLPFPIKDIPDVFNQFKKKTERDAILKPCFETPQVIKFLNIEDWGELPSINTLFSNKLLANEFSAKAQLSPFIGGELQALNYLDNLLEQCHELGKISPDYFSNLSVWLSLGSLSPRMVYWKLKGIEALNKSLFQKILLGLLWRDYYRFMFKKHGNIFFKERGFNSLKKIPPAANSSKLKSWKLGNTGQAEVDLIMQTLNTTGYITFPARALAASYLVQKLNQNWTLGAAYFEEMLLDYCPASNWGNWAQVAGVGNDAKTSAQFEFEKLLKGFENKKFHIASSRI